MSWYKILDDVKYPNHFPTENYYLMKNLALRQGDLIVCTYPKCGTNWISFIVWSILHPEKGPPQGNGVLRGDIPLVELFGLCNWTSCDADVPRTLATHLPPDKVPQSPGAKYIVVLRNPFDCCVSYYHFILGIGIDHWEKMDDQVPDSFFQEFMEGQGFFGDYFDHLLGHYSHRDEPNVLILTYEDVLKEPAEEILKIARFLGKAQPLEGDNRRLLNKIVEQSSFSFMKQNVKYYKELENGTREDIPICRKGQVGTYRDELSPEQIGRLRKKMEEKLAGTELLSKWKDL